MKKRIKSLLLVFLGLDDAESDIWAIRCIVDDNAEAMADRFNGLLNETRAIRSAVDSSVSALADNATAVAAKLNELERRADTYLNDIGRTRSTLIPMIDERLRVLEDKLSLIQEAAKPKEEKVIRHRRASEFKQAVERGLHQ